MLCPKFMFLCYALPPPLCGWYVLSHGYHHHVCSPWSTSSSSSLQAFCPIHLSCLVCDSALPNYGTRCSKACKLDTWPPSWKGLGHWDLLITFHTNDLIPMIGSSSSGGTLGGWSSTGLPCSGAPAALMPVTQSRDTGTVTVASRPNGYRCTQVTRLTHFYVLASFPRSSLTTVLCRRQSCTHKFDIRFFFSRLTCRFVCAVCLAANVIRLATNTNRPVGDAFLQFPPSQQPSWWL